MAKRGEAKVIQYQSILRRCLPRLLEDLDVNYVMDFIIQKEVIHPVLIRDIQEQVTTSKKIRMLINCLLKKTESSYKKFKECLKESGQTYIVDMLEEEERKQNQDKNILTENAPAKKKNSVRIKKHPTLQLKSRWRPAVKTISSLSKGSLEWQICPHLVTKNNIKRKMKLDGRYCKKIRAVVLKNTVIKFNKYYRYKKVKEFYYVSGAHVTDANPKYHQRAEIELKINNKTKKNRFTGAVDLLKIGEHDFVQINELNNKIDELVDVIGVVNYIGKIETVRTWIKDRETKREVDMVDKSGMTVPVTFWGRHARKFSLRKNSVLALLGVKVKEDWKGITLSSQSNTQVNIDPDIPEAHLLRKWYDSKGKKMTFPYVQ